MSSTENHLYRFYPLPSEESAKAIFKRDRIKIDSSTTINDVLKKLNSRYESRFNRALNPEELGEPYFSLYKLNFLINGGCLYASTFSSFNDIFEGTVWLGEDILLDLAGREGFPSKEDVKQLFAEDKLPWPSLVDPILKEDIGKYGIISFCRKYQDPLMWGHYANGHNGVCIRFSVNSFLNSLWEGNTEDAMKMCTGLYNDKGVIHWANIRYTDSPETITNELIQSYKKYYPEFVKEFPGIQNIIKSSRNLLLDTTVAMVKSKNWKNEEETRLWILNDGGEIPLSNLTISDENSLEKGKPYLIADALILGNNILPKPPKGIIYNLIANSIDKGKFPDLQIKAVVPKANSYDVEISDDVENCYRIADCRLEE